MSLVVLSNNTYLKIALNAIIDGQYDICIIDLTSFNTLAELTLGIEVIQKRSLHRVVLLGGERDAISRILQPFQVNKLNTPINHLQDMITTKHCSLDDFQKKLTEIYLLKTLSSKEKSLVDELLLNKTLRQLNQGREEQKAVYYHINNAGKKLNLKSGREFIFFLARENNMILTLF